MALHAPNLSRHDLIYERPPGQWCDGIPLANGLLGAMIWGDGCPLKFTLDHYDVWEQRTPWPGDDPRFTYANLRRLKEAGKFDELNEVAQRRRNLRYEVSGNRAVPPYPTRLSLGRLELRWPRAPKAFAARLDLQSARATMNLTFARGTATVRSFTCATPALLVIEVEVGLGVRLPTVRLAPAPMDEFSAVHFKAWKYPKPKLRRTADGQVLFRRYAVDKEYSIVTREVRAERRLTIWLTIVAGAADGASTARAEQILGDAARGGVPACLRVHQRDWASYWKRSAIKLPDSLLENLYYVEMYKHRCLSRPGGRPITLQGLWTTDGAWPPWRGSYTTDMNVQESYWPIYIANQLESGDPLFEMYWRNLPYHRRIGQYFYGKPVAVITGEHGPGGEPFPGFVADEHSPGHGAWIAHLFWWRWRYSMDREFLRTRAYPFLREMLQAYLHILEKRGDGKYHIPFTDSPEIYNGQPQHMGDDTTYDVMLLRFLLTALLEAQKELEKPDADAARWRKYLTQLVEAPTVPCRWHEQRCLALRPGTPLFESHRHHSHLIGIYPLGVGHGKVASEAGLVEASLRDLVGKGTGEWAGWSYPWAALVAGRANQQALAFNYLRTYAQTFIAPNTLHLNGDWKQTGGCANPRQAMTLEAGFAAAAAILEMLLQSHGEVIRVFPGCPVQWQDVSFRELRAEGAFLVSARKVNGEVQEVRVGSETGGVCRMRNPCAGAVKLYDARTRRMLRGEILSFRTKRGGTYVLVPDKQVVNLRRRGQRTAAAATNWFGVKQVPRF